MGLGSRLGRDRPCTRRDFVLLCNFFLVVFTDVMYSSLTKLITRFSDCLLNRKLKKSHPMREHFNTILRRQCRASIRPGRSTIVSRASPSRYRHLRQCYQTLPPPLPRRGIMKGAGSRTTFRSSTTTLDAYTLDQQSGGTVCKGTL